MNYTANDTLNEIARTFYGTDHEDWLRFNDGELRLGNMKVWVDGDKLLWKDLGLPRIAGIVEIPEGTEMEEELPDGSYIGDVIDEVGEWLLHWTDDIDDGVLLACLQNEIGGEITEDVYGDPVLVADDVWSVVIDAGEETSPLLRRGSLVSTEDDGGVEAVWVDSYPIDPELAATWYERQAVDEAYRGLIEEAGL